MRKSDQANKVRAYIKANPKAKASVIAKECGVNVQYVYSLKYHDKRKAKSKRKAVVKATPVNKLPEVQKATVPEHYTYLMDKINRLTEMVNDRDVVIAYLEHKLETRNETNK